MRIGKIGKSESGQKWCSNRVPYRQFIFKEGGAAELVFHSDSSINKTGFAIEINRMETGMEAS